MEYIPLPVHVIKDTIFVRESKWKYHIDEDGNGIAYIETYKVAFYVNEYGEILVESIHLIN